MTVQTMERLLLRGEEIPLATTPLENFWEQSPPRPTLEPPNTACWRGYVGTWGIDDGQLFLLNIEEAEVSSDESPVTVDSLFPGSAGRVRADWFTGNLYCPLGEANFTVDGDMVYDRHLVIEIAQGRVVRERVTSSESAAGTTHSYTNRLMKMLDNPHLLQVTGTLAGFAGLIMQASLGSKPALGLLGGLPLMTVGAALFLKAHEGRYALPIAAHALLVGVLFALGGSAMAVTEHVVESMHVGELMQLTMLLAVVAGWWVILALYMVRVAKWRGGAWYPLIGLAVGSGLASHLLL